VSSCQRMLLYKASLEACLVGVAAAGQAAASPAADLRNDTRGHLRSVLPAAAAVHAAPTDVSWLLPAELSVW